MAVTIVQLNDAIATTLDLVTEIAQVQDLDELREGMNTRAVVQVYPETVDFVATNATDRITMGSVAQKPIRQKEFVFHVDVYARQRSHLGQDLAKVFAIVDPIITKLEAQDAKPYFGNQYIQAWHVSGERVSFKYGDAEVSYAGYRFVITLTVY